MQLLHATSFCPANKQQWFLAFLGASKIPVSFLTGTVTLVYLDTECSDSLADIMRQLWADVAAHHVNSCLGAQGSSKNVIEIFIIVEW